MGEEDAPAAPHKPTAEGEQPDASTEELARLRHRIDAINLEMLRLLERRGGLVLDVTRLKQRTGWAIHDPGREAAMLVELLRYSRGLYDQKEIEGLFHNIFETSRSLAARVGHLPGTGESDELE